MNQYVRAPHAGPDQNQAANNAALLIDFDNVTMGMRSDLAKEFKNLLKSDVIKGKVTVQRAYADWRRYPQYIVPLSEASIDLIFAPAYGSSKKNATDIRMAIDGMELVFIRPEIGTFILLTGDSDFSSLVLKLKEYGKYVIGIGLQESSSDILVQNCDEYYSYTSVAGLSKTSEGGRRQDGLDPWQCASEAVARMASRGDAMRSDRLKQVMMELSPNFDERNLGFKKFSKFVAEAAKKGLLRIERRENGQYEVTPVDGASGGRRGDASSGTGRSSRAGKSSTPNGQAPRRRDRKGSAPEPAPIASKADAAATTPADTEPDKDRRAALQLLGRALREFGEKAEQGVRDSDVKRKLIALDDKFDESRLGFGKFSKFLFFAETEGVAVVSRLEGGSFEVRAPSPAAEPDAKNLGLPTTVESIKSYLANRYKGIGVKTADKLVASFGTRLFDVLRDEPEKVRDVLPRARAVRVLAAWDEDHNRRAKQPEARAKATPRSSPPRDRSDRPTAKPTSRTSGPPADKQHAPPIDRQPSQRANRRPTQRAAHREAASASAHGTQTVHEPRVRHFGRGRTGAKADHPGRSEAGARRPDADALAEAASVAAQPDPPAQAATATTATPPASSPPDPDAPAPRKRTGTGVLGFLRRGRGRTADGE